MERFFTTSAKLVSLFINWCCAAFMVIFLSTISCLAVADVSQLQPLDCVKCHPYKLKMLSEGGGKHEKIGCLSCHPHHPPTEENTKASCQSCHEDLPHFQGGGCLDCHVNPHRPIKSLQDTSKPAKKECLPCHQDVGQHMTKSRSRHAELFCTRCHSQHKLIPGCLDCHEPHQQIQFEADCAKCHPAHQPLNIVPAGYIPAAFCSVCHKKEARDLADTKTNHGGLNCVYCHKDLHPSIPKCQDCHGLPHGQKIHSKYRRCLSCHGDAHSLISNR